MIKRSFDILLSLFGLVLFLPLFFLVALLVWVEDRGPALFMQTRVGRDGLKFKMFKFRSMSPKPGASLTIGHDPRITLIGRMLRATKLDELPQLWNVLKGEMSFVGPRPEIEKFVNLYSERERGVLSLKPGITDPASLAMYDEASLLYKAKDPEQYYIKVIMPAKIQVNLEYADQASIFTDFMVIAFTLLRALGIKIEVFRWFKLTPIQVDPAENGMT